MNLNSERPLVTFIVCTYNQSKYIEEAINGAFSQTYSPLEIIISDDCSKDSTFNIIQKKISEYDGPHKVKSNRNSTNLGIGMHINRVMELASGELVVGSAGDDISLPDRTKVIVERWMQHNKNTASIFSSVIIIDDESRAYKTSQLSFIRSLNDTEKYIEKNLFVLGASAAWSRDVFDRFGPLHKNIVHEDKAIPFRAKLLGGDILFIKKPLVKYRQNIGISRSVKPESGGLSLYQLTPQYAERSVNDYLQKYSDIKKIKANEHLIRICRKKLIMTIYALRLARNSRKLKVTIKYIKNYGISVYCIAEFVKYKWPSFYEYRVKTTAKIKRIPARFIKIFSIQNTKIN